jgi:DNA-binding NarL/FixJ family response regulator
MVSVAVCIRTRIYRDGLAAALRSLPEVDSVELCDSMNDLRKAITAGVGVALVDPREEGGNRPSERVVGDLCALKPPCPIVVLGCDTGDDEIVGLLEVGAAAYVTTDDTIEDLVATLRAAVRGELYCSPRMARRLQERLASLATSRRRGAHRERLSQREQEVLALVRRGRSNKQIARELCLELATVKNHMHNAIVKLNVRNRFEAAAATRDG